MEGGPMNLETHELAVSYYTNKWEIKTICKNKYR